MDRSTVPVNYYMSEPVYWATPADSHARVRELLHHHRVAGLAVFEGERRDLAGVITRTDLLRVDDPSALVGDHMTPEVVTISASQPVVSAAATMIERTVHRLFVRGAEGIIGVLSTTDLMLAVRDFAIAAPLETYMSKPVFAIDVREPIGAADALLAGAGENGLVVRDGVWPIGLYTDLESLESKQLDRETPIEQAMSQELVTAPNSMPIYRVAGQAAVLGVRRVVVMERGSIAGVLTGMDFARACADAA